MLKYIVKRILQMIPMLLVLSLVVFFMVRLIPGDPVTMMLGQGAGKEAIAAETARLGLDKPLWQQYFIWMGNLFHGDFGTSIFTHKPVLYEIQNRYPTTLTLAVGATILSTIVGVLCGIVSAVKHGKLADNILMVTSLTAVSTPSFFLAMILMLIFCLWLKWLPVSGFDTWKSMILPIVTLGAQEVGHVCRPGGGVRAGAGRLQRSSAPLHGGPAEKCSQTASADGLFVQHPRHGSQPQRLPRRVPFLPPLRGRVRKMRKGTAAAVPASGRAQSALLEICPEGRQ